MNNNNIKLELRDNKLYFEITFPDDDHYIMRTIRLGNLENDTLFWSKCSENKFEFTINKNSTYKVYCSYYKGSEIRNISSKPIKINLKNPSIEEIKNKIILSAKNNKIFCDGSQIRKLCSKIVSCKIFLNKQLITEQLEISDFHTELSIPITATYQTLITYRDFDHDEHTIPFEIFVERKALSIRGVENVPVNRQKQSLSLLFHIIYAFIVREFQRKYDKGYFRYFSIILGPTVQLGILVVIFSIMGTKKILGLQLPIFILTGMLPYTFFTSAGNCLTIVSGNRELLSYKQIKIIDVIISSILMELLVTISVFSLGIFICWFLNMKVTIYNPLSLILSFILLFSITFGVGIILSVIGFYFAEFNYAIQVIFRALFYISGVFFSVESIPVQYQKYVLWNPLLQIIEFIRFSFVSFNLPHELSYLYLLKCTIIMLLIGVSLYFINRNKFMVNDRAR